MSLLRLLNRSVRIPYEKVPEPFAKAAFEEVERQFEFLQTAIAQARVDSEDIGTVEWVDLTDTDGPLVAENFPKVNAGATLLEMYDLFGGDNTWTGLNTHDRDDDIQINMRPSSFTPGGADAPIFINWSGTVTYGLFGGAVQGYVMNGKTIVTGNRVSPTLNVFALGDGVSVQMEPSGVGRTLGQSIAYASIPGIDNPGTGLFTVHDTDGSYLDRPHFTVSGGGSSRISANWTSFESGAIWTGHASLGGLDRIGLRYKDTNVLAGEHFGSQTVVRSEALTGSDDNRYLDFPATHPPTNPADGSIHEPNIWFAGLTPSYGGGDGVVGIANATDPPSSGPLGGLLLWSEGTTLNLRGSDRPADSGRDHFGFHDTTANLGSSTMSLLLNADNSATMNNVDSDWAMLRNTAAFNAADSGASPYLCVDDTTISVLLTTTTGNRVFANNRIYQDVAGLEYSMNQGQAAYDDNPTMGGNQGTTLYTAFRSAGIGTTLTDRATGFKVDQWGTTPPTTRRAFWVEDISDSPNSEYLYFEGGAADDASGSFHRPNLQIGSLTGSFGGGGGVLGIADAWNAVSAQPSGGVILESGGGNLRLWGPNTFGHFLPTTDEEQDLGGVAFTWKDLFIKGAFKGTDGKVILDLIGGSSPVNYLEIESDGTGNNPKISAAGENPNIGLVFRVKGGGAGRTDYRFNRGDADGFGNVVPGITNAQDLGEITTPRIWRDLHLGRHLVMSGDSIADFKGTGLEVNSNVLESNHDTGLNFEAAEHIEEIVVVKLDPGTSRSDAVPAIAADPDLMFAVGANEDWIFRFIIFVDRDDIATPGGIDFDIHNNTATGSISYGFHTLDIVGGGITKGQSDDFDIPHNVALSEPEKEVIIIEGSVEITGTGGTIEFRWAQETGDATNGITVHGKSTCIAHRNP